MIGIGRADAQSSRGRNGRPDARGDAERRHSADPNAHLPPLLEALAPADNRDTTLPSVQVAGLEQAAPDAHPAAQLPPLRTRLEATACDADDVPSVQVAALADAKRAEVNQVTGGKGKFAVVDALITAYDDARPRWTFTSSPRAAGPEPRPHSTVRERLEQRLSETPGK